MSASKNLMESVVEHRYEDENSPFPATGNELIDSVITERNVAITLVDEILERFKRLNTLKAKCCPVLGGGFESLVYDIINNVSGYSETFTVERAKIVAKIDSRYWHLLLESSRLTAVMNTKKKESMRSLIQDKTQPFESEVVYGTLNHYLSRRMVTFVESVIDVFSGLTSTFKSNDKICFKRRIIFSGAFTASGWNHYSSGRDKINDLEQIFTLLDGKDPTQFNESSAVIVLERASNSGVDEVTLPYFRCKLFGNGNVHLWFTNQDLVLQINELLARHYGQALGNRMSKNN